MLIYVVYHDNSSKTFRNFAECVNYHSVKILRCESNDSESLPRYLPVRLEHLQCRF